MKALNKKKGIRDKGELIFYLSLIALPILQIIIFYFYVNFNSILMAFQRYNTKQGKFYFDDDIFVNFTKMWANRVTIFDSLKNSLLVFVFVTGLGTFLSLIFSYYIYKKWFLGKTFKFFLFLPHVMPSILMTLVFRFFIDEAIPGYSVAITGAEIPPTSWLNDPDMLWPTIILYNLLMCFGGGLLINTGAMEQISIDVIEAGKLDGVKPVREFFSIVLPMIRPIVATFLIASVAGLFMNQANLYSFFKDHKDLGPQNYTIGYYLFLLGKGDLGKVEYTYASALGLVCTAVAFPLTLLARRVLNGKEDD